MSKMKCISNNIRFVFAFRKKNQNFSHQIFWPLWPFKNRHPIQVNDLGSCHPMWPHHMIAWQLHFGISSKFKIFQTWNFMTEFHDSWRLQFHLKISSGEFQSPFLQILVLHLFSFLFFYSRPFFIISSSCLMDNLLFSVLYLLTNSSSTGSSSSGIFFTIFCSIFWLGRSSESNFNSFSWASLSFFSSGALFALSLASQFSKKQIWGDIHSPASSKLRFFIFPQKWPFSPQKG